MGHLCSCHRDVNFDKDATRAWKTDASLIHKLRLRCSYLTASAGGKLPCLPQRDVNDQHLTSSEAHKVVDRRLPASSPSSPALSRPASAPPKPLLADGRDGKRVDWVSELDLSSVSVRNFSPSTSLRTLVVDYRRRTTNSLLRHTCELLISSAVRPEVLVDLLRGRDAVSEETAAAVRGCVGRRPACELIAEVVVSRGEVETLCDGLRATGCGDVADCLAAVDSLLQLTDLSRTQCHHCAMYSSSINAEKKTGDCGSRCTCSDESETGSSYLQSSVNIEVVDVDPFTGNVVDDGEQSTPTTRRSSSFRHRSTFVDRQTTSLSPSQLVDLAARPQIDRTVALPVPVASVTFHRVCLFDRLANRLADILHRRRGFRVMTFVQCRHVDECLRRIRRLLVDRKCKLSRLHVRLCCIDDVDVFADLAEVLSSSLQALSLTGCSIMSAGCATLVQSLVTGNRCLLELDLGFNDVVDVGPLSDALAANCSLRRLRLRGNAIGSDGAETLFRSLRRNYRLDLLDISGNAIGDGNGLWNVLADALVTNRTLRELSLERCSLGVEACSALGRALAANTTLQVLDVSMNQSIGDLGVAVLTDGLRRNRRSGVRTLAVNMCAVGNVGFRSILLAVKDGGATALRDIKLCYNLIGSDDQRRQVRVQSGPGVTDGSRRSSTRPRPASAHFQTFSSTPLSEGWQTDGGRKLAETVPSSTPMSRKNVPVAVRRRISGSIRFSRQPVVQCQQPSTSCENLVAADCDDNGAASDCQLATTTAQQLDINELMTPTNRCLQLSHSSDDMRDVDELLDRVTDEDRDVEVTDDVNVYTLLCQVLRVNPQLKVLLWGNRLSQYCADSGMMSRKDMNDIGESATESSFSVGKTTSNAHTLPRNYQFAPCFN